MSPLQYKVSEYLTLRLEDNDTVIYVNNQKFLICKHLLLTIPQNKKTQDEIRSIDEAQYAFGNNSDEFMLIEMEIIPKQKFWGHCSNLQAWYENDYNTRLLHSNLAFPLLKRLMEVGDIKAKKVFKEEIAKRLEENYAPVNQLLIEEDYLEYLSREELESCCPNKLKVDKLVLASRRLTDIPALIRNLPIQGLRSLNLMNNCLTSFPSFILEYKTLEVLLINENQLRYLPESISELTKLRRLEVSNNQLESLPSSVGDLKSLEELILYDNNLTSIPDSIGKLVSLKKLILTNNKLQELPISIGKLTNLEHLSLSLNKLSSLPSSLSNLESLKSIDLSDNKFQKPSTIEFVKNLNLRAARNNANSIIQNAEQFLSKNNSLTSKQKSTISRKIKSLKEAMDSDDYEEIKLRTHDLLSY